MLDVHVLVMHYTPTEEVDRCVDSITHAASLCAFPVRLCLLNGVVGHIGRGRATGYALGHQLYVTYVDDDDEVMPLAFAQMEDALKQRVAAVFTPELQQQNGQRSKGPSHHHLIAIRRDKLIDHQPWVVCGDLAQMAALERDLNTVDMPMAGYVHHLYQSRGRALRRDHHDELRKARG